MNGQIGQYEFYVSADGTNWGTPVATGTFANNATEKEVLFTQKTGKSDLTGTFTTEGGNRPFNSPFNGDAVLYLNKK